MKAARNYKFGMKDLRNRADNQKVQEQRELYLKNMNKHNQFLSKKYVDTMKADFNSKMGKNKMRKQNRNIKYHGLTQGDSKATVSVQNSVLHSNEKELNQNLTAPPNPVTLNSRKGKLSKLESKNNYKSYEDIMEALQSKQTP
jgi:hypothetical protein